MKLDCVHEVRTNMEDEEGCVDVVRDMEQRGRPVAITGSRGRAGEVCKREETVSADIIRNQVDGSKGHLHEVGNAEVSDHVLWNAKRRGEVYHVRWGKTSWITNMQELSEAAREARRGKKTWESVVETGVKNIMRNKGMITMTEEHSPHVEEAKAEAEEV